MKTEARHFALFFPKNALKPKGNGKLTKRLRNIWWLLN